MGFNKWIQRFTSHKYLDEDNPFKNYFLNDMQLIEESQEYNLDLDSDPKKCIKCSGVYMDWSDLSDHMRKIHEL